MDSNVEVNLRHGDVRTSLPRIKPYTKGNDPGLFITTTTTTKGFFVDGGDFTFILPNYFPVWGPPTIGHVDAQEPLRVPERTHFLFSPGWTLLWSLTNYS